MEVKTEPAGRLFDIFNEARQKPENETARKVWASIFNVPEKDTGSILKMLADLIQLTHQTKEKIKSIEDIDHALYIRPFTNIERILSKTNLDAPWKSWKLQIDEPTIYGLQFCSDKLNRLTNYTKINDEEIEGIKESLSNLTDQVLGSELPDVLKELLVRNLERLRQALLSYKIKGIDGIEQELELNLGSIYLHKNEIRDNSDVENNSVVWSAYFKFLEGLNKTLATAKNIKELGGKELLKILGMDSD